MRRIPMAPLCLAVLCGLMGGARCEAARDRPLVGAIRWDAWTRWAGETGWGG